MNENRVKINFTPEIAVGMQTAILPIAAMVIGRFDIVSNFLVNSGWRLMSVMDAPSAKSVEKLQQGLEAFVRISPTWIGRARAVQAILGAVLDFDFNEDPLLAHLGRSSADEDIFFNIPPVGELTIEFGPRSREIVFESLFIGFTCASRPLILATMLDGAEPERMGEFIKFLENGLCGSFEATDMEKTIRKMEPAIKAIMATEEGGVFCHELLKKRFKTVSYLQQAFKEDLFKNFKHSDLF